MYLKPELASNDCRRRQATWIARCLPTLARAGDRPCKFDRCKATMQRISCSLSGGYSPKSELAMHSSSNRPASWRNSSCDVSERRCSLNMRLGRFWPHLFGAGSCSMLMLEIPQTRYPHNFLPAQASVCPNPKALLMSFQDRASFIASDLSK